uniref:YEATS domain-containing protein 2 n=1 Tax=Poecilia formosa TaxID=48698 RepID=A0A096LWM5_POEFO
MSGIKRKIEDNDPDYDDISLVQSNKRNKTAELSAREATVQRIENIIREQFSLEMKNKEHEIDVISQRLNEARRMMDKLRACIVANYFASSGITKPPEHNLKSDPAVLNHPAIRRFLESPSRSSSPLNQGSETQSLAHSECESLSQQGDGTERNGEGTWREDGGKQERRPGRNTGKDTFGVPSPMDVEQRVTYHTTGDEASRLYVKKTIVVGNVSKYIPPDKREENDQSTHKWMVYVRGSRREPSIDHFVKKVWFFLHPSYKPNDLVEVSEPPFHLTRRGWGEFPVRIQIHFKDSRNKRIDIIHQLKLDRTYTGLQTLGAETVIDVELHRDSLGEDCIPKRSSSSNKASLKAASPMSTPALAQTYGHPSSPVSHEFGAEKGLAAGERTPTRPRPGDRVTLGSPGNSAFQPITASCKIVPQGQAPSPAESPGKLFQPITMSCKIVSGKCFLSGSPSAKQAQGARSPAPKVHTGTFLSSGVKVSLSVSLTKQCGINRSPGCSADASVLAPIPSLCVSLQVIIKQEPGEVSTQQQQMVSTVTSQQQAHQFVAVKGGHMISMSSQKRTGEATGSTTSKMLGIPVSSTLQSSVKQVAISSGQILVAKGSPSVSKVMAGKQVLAQGVAKAIVSGTGSITAQQGGAKAAGGSGGKSGVVMATLQLPANNLANLANLPPGTKLYLTTNSKNPSGKGKLLLIPQGAILRASGASHQSQSGPSAGASSSQNSSSSSSSGSLPSNLSYTSYILKQTPQGTFLVGQPSQGSGKQGSSSSAGHSGSSTATSTQQAIRVTAGQKAAILAQVVGSSQGAQLKLSDGSVKTVTAAGAGHMSKPGTTTLRMTGGVITAASSAPISAAGAAASQQQVKGAATVTKSAASSSGAVVTLAKGVTNMPVVSMSKGAGAGAVVATVKTEPSAGPAITAGPSTPVSTPAPPVAHVPSAVTAVKQEQGADTSAHDLIKVCCNKVLTNIHLVNLNITEHIETMMQLLTAVVKKFPLIVPDKTEDSHPFCASSVEQYYSWNIGKRRASELQRAVAVKRVVQDVLDRSPRLQALTPPKTKEVVQWCRQRGYTPPDPEPQHRNDDESIEDILTQIDNEPECPSTLSSYDELLLRLEQMQALLKTEPEEEDDEIVDIVTVTPPCQKLKVKEEEQETDVEPKFFLGPCTSSQFVSETAQQIGVLFQPVEVEKSLFAPVIEAMILKATEQFASDILREALAGAHAKSPPNRPPREITAMNIHQAVSSIPTCDFLTNAHMGYLTKDNDEVLV